jgi:catechol 2,3-dioxygenase-like lactoylglutathione lyase family enzyme
MTNTETDSMAAAQTSAPPIRVKHIDHVTIVVRDLDRSRDFYVGVLGMQEVERPGFHFAGLWFQAGPTQVHLILEHPESGPSGHSIAAEAAISRTRHFAFEVADARAAQQCLEESGVAIVAGPKSRPDGPTQLYVRDPDGHLVELFSFA